MKQDFLPMLESFKERLRELRHELRALDSDRVSKINLRTKADEIASEWVEKIRSPLEHKFKIEKKVIDDTADRLKKLHILSRPNNLKSSYLKCIDVVFKKFDDKFVLPIKQMASEPASLLELNRLIPGLSNADESSY